MDSLTARQSHAAPDQVPAGRSISWPGVRGPLAERWRNRLISLFMLVPCLTVLIIAAALTPDSRGFGTHTELGLAPCGFKEATGLPCATCGMTTAFSHVAHGQYLAAVQVQPAGTVLAILTAMGVLVLGYAAVTGISLAPLGRALWQPRSILLLAGLVLLGWAYTLSLTMWT